MIHKTENTRIWQQWPSHHSELRDGIYRGKLFKKQKTSASQKAVSDTLNLLEAELGTTDVRLAQKHMSADDFFESIGRIRKQLFMDEQHRQNVHDVIIEMGFDPEEIAYEPFRLRVIQHLGHENPRAAAVYYPHRDTWYAHPQCLMVGWLPLHDLEEHETFEVYPDWWDLSVPNNSEIFDYSQWVLDGWQLKIGWQHKMSGVKANYPQATSKVEVGRRVGFKCDAASNIIFPGGHFHKTLEQATGKTRFSLDFRMVHLGDLAENLGAPNVDTRCKGNAVVDYLHPPHCSGISNE
jgi:hypothetical protein